MKGKKKKICVILIVLVLLGLVINSSIFNMSNPSNSKVKSNSVNTNQKTESRLDQLKTNELELPDKVYTFFSGFYTIIFEDLYLEEDYMYYIHIELVTPHNVTNMDISIWDPDEKQFHVFESKMFYEPEYGRYFDIPYGTVMNGKHTFRFDSTSDYNYNLYIRIEQGLKCLHDQIEKPENIISQDGSRFYYEKSIHHVKNLETDISYTIHIGRVSAIAITENFEVRLDCTIYDKNGVPFVIYENDVLKPMGVYYICPECESVLSATYECPECGQIDPDDAIRKLGGHNAFNFGTAISGEYDVKIRIYCNVEYVNVAYAISNEYQISEIEKANETSAPPPSKNVIEETLEEVENSIPIEWLIGMIIFIGGVIGPATLGLMKYKKKGTANIEVIKKK